MKCPECQTQLVADANYCTNCGVPVREGIRRHSSAPWILAGIALLALVVVLVLPSIREQHNTTAGRVPIEQLEDDENAPPQLTGTPREQADRLFNRIMTERETGDTARAKFFLPMGIQAYEMSGELDADGHYHLSLLQAFAGDFKGARASADTVLATQPKHLLALSAAAQAARGEGDLTAAKKYYRDFLSAYDDELKTDKEEYLHHSRVLPDLKKEAEQFKGR